MTTEDGNRVFLDTDVLVHANVEESPLHQVALEAIEVRYEEGDELWVSRQILREYLATFSRPQRFANPQPAAVLIVDVRHFQGRFRIAEDNPLSE